MPQKISGHAGIFDVSIKIEIRNINQTMFIFLGLELCRKKLVTMLLFSVFHKHRNSKHCVQTDLIFWGWNCAAEGSVPCCKFLFFVRTRRNSIVFFGRV